MQQINKHIQSILFILPAVTGLSTCKKGEVINTVDAVILTKPTQNQIFAVSDTITIEGIATRQDYISIEASLIDSRDDTVFKEITPVSGDSIPFSYKTTLSISGIYTADIIARTRDGGTGKYVKIRVQ